MAITVQLNKRHNLHAAPIEICCILMADWSSHGHHDAISTHCYNFHFKTIRKNNWFRMAGNCDFRTAISIPIDKLVDLDGEPTL